jgi:hypothetical protein
VDGGSSRGVGHWMVSFSPLRLAFVLSFLLGGRPRLRLGDASDGSRRSGSKTTGNSPSDSEELGDSGCRPCSVKSNIGVDVLWRWVTGVDGTEIGFIN